MRERKRLAAARSAKEKGEWPGLAETSRPIVDNPDATGEISREPDNGVDPVALVGAACPSIPPQSTRRPALPISPIRAEVCAPADRRWRTFAIS